MSEAAPPPSPRPKPLTLPTINPELPNPRTLLPPEYSNSIQAPDIPSPSKLPKQTIPTPLATPKSPKSPTWSGPTSPGAAHKPVAPPPANTHHLKRLATEVTYQRCQHACRVFFPKHALSIPSPTEDPPPKHFPHACEDCTKAAATSSEISLRRHYRHKIWELETWVKGLVPGKGQQGYGIDVALMDARYMKAQEIRDLKALRDFEINQAWKEYELFFQSRPKDMTLDSDGTESETDSLMVEALSDHSDISDHDPDQDVRSLVLDATARKDETSAEKAKREWEERGKAEYARGIEEEIAGMKEKVGNAWEKGKVNDDVLDSCRMSEEAREWWREKDAVGFLRYEKRIRRIEKAEEKRRQGGHGQEKRILVPAGEGDPVVEKRDENNQPEEETLQ